MSYREEYRGFIISFIKDHYEVVNQTTNEYECQCKTLAEAKQEVDMLIDLTLYFQ